MNKTVKITFELDLSEYVGITTDEQVTQLVQAMMRGEADWPEHDVFRIEVEPSGSATEQH